MTDAFRQFEEFCRAKGLRPCARASMRRGEMYVADTQKEFDFARVKEYPAGFYQVFWCYAAEGKMQIGRWLEFDALHDISLSDSERRKARIQAGKLDAEAWYWQFIEKRAIQ